MAIAPGFTGPWKGLMEEASVKHLQWPQALLKPDTNAMHPSLSHHVDKGTQHCHSLNLVQREEQEALKTDFYPLEKHHKARSLTQGWKANLAFLRP